MISKNKDNFNLSNKTVYKYNIVKNKKSIINKEDILNSLKKDDMDLNGKIDEYYHSVILLDFQRNIHKFEFTINE